MSDAQRPIDPPPPDVAPHPYDESRLLADQGDFDGAVAALFHGLDVDDRLPPIDVIARLAELRPMEDLAAAAGSALGAPWDPNALLHLGLTLLDVGAARLAVPYARAAFVADPSAHLLAPYAAILLGAQQPEAASELLQVHRTMVDSEPVLTYQLGLSAVLSGDLALARDAARSLPTATNDVEARRSAQLWRMVNRADVVAGSCPLDGADLRGWHLVLTGGLLLGISPYGLHDGMNGRWAAVWDSYANIRASLERALEVLDVWGRHPRVILGLPGIGNQALARAMARLAGATIEPAQPDSRPGLIVGYDLAELDADGWFAVEQAVEVRDPARPYFLHAACWTDPPRHAPDLVTMLHQVLIPPWEEELTRDGQQQGWAQGPPAGDGVVAEELVSRILDADPSQGMIADDQDQVVRIAAALTGIAGPTATKATREPFWMVSPVGSARFA